MKKKKTPTTLSLLVKNCKGLILLLWIYSYLMLYDSDYNLLCCYLNLPPLPDIYQPSSLFKNLSELLKGQKYFQKV